MNMSDKLVNTNTLSLSIYVF
uniref:Uncharacterized protein n=1 Tax=Lepeophtheirus salmonis TaxID=72036 RepID=A0A0K2VA54_LEPSM